MSKIFRKTLNKISASSSERSSKNNSDTESTGSSSKTDKPRRSLSLRRSSKEKEREKDKKKDTQNGAGARVSSSPKTSLDSTKVAKKNPDQPAKPPLEETPLEVKREEPQEPILSPIDVSVNIVDEQSDEENEGHPQEYQENQENSQDKPQKENQEVSTSAVKDLESEPQPELAPVTSPKYDGETEESSPVPYNPSEAEPVKAPSSPHKTNSPGISPVLEEIASELEPLLQNSRSHEARDESGSGGLLWNSLLLLKKVVQYLSLNDPKALHFVILLLILIAVGLYFVFSNIDSLISQSVEVDFSSISLSKINDDGVDSHLTGSVYVNYDKIGNVFYKNVLKAGGFILGGITIIPHKQVKLYAKPSQLDIAPLHLVDIYPPPFTIDVIHKSLTDIDFITKIKIIKEDAVKLSRDILKFKDNDFDLDLQGVFNSEIQTKFYNFNTNEINVYDKVTIPKEYLNPQVDVNKFEVFSKGETVNIYTEISLGDEYPFEFSVQSINWDVLVPDCDGKLVSFGNWKSKNFKLHPNIEIKVDVEGELDKISNRLTDECDDGTDSPLNKIVQRYLSDQPIHVEIRGSKEQDETLPGWLYYILSDTSFGFDVVLPRNSADLGTLEFSSIEVEVPNKVFSNLELSAFLKSNVSLVVDYPYGITFGIPRFKSNFTIKDNSSNALISGSSYDFNHVDIVPLNDTQLRIDVNLNSVDVEVLQPKKVGKLLNSVINEQEFSLEGIYVDLQVDELVFESDLFNSELNGLKLRHISIPKRLGNSGISVQNFSDSPLQAIFSQLNLTIDSVIYVDSTVDGLNLVCDFELSNPTNLSLDLPNEKITFDLEYNGTKFGRGVFDDLYIPTGGRFNSSLRVELLTAGVDDKVKFEEFMSAYISGYDNITVDISNVGAKSSGLNELLQQISINDVDLPPVQFHGLDEEGDSIGLRGSYHASPFLIEATIHVFSSEVELKLFNPLSNAEILVDLYQAEALTDGVILGHLQKSELMLVTPGIYKTPKIPIKISDGIGMDILRRAINGDLEVDVLAVFKIRLGHFEAQLMYRGHGLKSQIRF